MATRYIMRRPDTDPKLLRVVIVRTDEERRAVKRAGYRYVTSREFPEEKRRAVALGYEIRTVDASDLLADSGRARPIAPR